MRYFLFLTPYFFSLAVAAQELLPTPRNIQKAYDKGTRSIDGSPGKNYWQNTANYDINVHFDPASRLINGTVNIQYVNNSPDTLRQIYLKLYPNLYKNTSPRDGFVDKADLTEGVSIDSLWINNENVPATRMNISGTNSTISRVILAHAQTLQLKITYHYTLNKKSHMRTGEIEPGAAFIAYFFPRIAVYDDIDGWNTFPYKGTLEFYNDFCNFKTSITVPLDFVVWATGDLQNANEVLTAEYARRLQYAEQHDEITDIIDSTDLKKGNITNKTKTENTWRFNADNVTDVAFAVSDHYLWKSSSLVVDPVTKRRTRVDAAFNAKHKDYFAVAGDARKTVEVMSYIFPAWPFPYSHETVFDGLDQMEYPMMVNDNPVEDRMESVTLTDHEIFHTMFPFYMGINETKYAWMDEGWATIGEWLVSPYIDSTIVDEYGVGPVASTAGNEYDLPIVTPSTELNRGYFTNSYPKPAMGYLYIKDYLGDELFKKALHHYIEQWRGKHPLPNDFFYSVNQGAGQNLNWFWKMWFFDNGIPDLSIVKVNLNKKGADVHIRKHGKWVPVTLTIYYSDGTTEKIHRTLSVWIKATNMVIIQVTTSKKITKIVVGDPHVPDADKKDNVWEAK